MAILRALRFMLFFLILSVNCFAQYGAMSSDELRQKAEAGDLEAQFHMGSRYDSGDRVPRDGNEAVKWYRRAAEAGHIEAQNSMGSVLQAEKRYEDARAWYEKAAAQGSGIATNNLAYFYDLGLGVKQDRRKGFELYTRAAELGWAEAMWNLANMYGAGQLGEKDLDMACVWTFRSLKYVQTGWRARLAPASRATGFFERSFSKERLETCKRRADDWKPVPAAAGRTLPKQGAEDASKTTTN